MERGYFSMAEHPEEEVLVPTTHTGLGPLNDGEFGPTPSTDRVRLYSDASQERYHLPATDVWVCVDGRGEAEDEPSSETEVNPQMPGTLSITNTAADFMNPQKVGALRLSETVAVNTSRALAHGNELIVHGDEARGKDGCAARAMLRPALAYGAANVDIIAPVVWIVSKGFGLDRFGITQKDVVDSIVAGGETAKNDTVWDATPEQVADIEIAHGATYVKLPGKHRERFAGLELAAHTAYDNRGFARDHQNENGEEDQGFAAAVGKYVHDTFTERVTDGYTPRDAALHAMRGVAYLVALTKKISNQEMEALLFGEAEPVQLPVAA